LISVSTSSIAGTVVGKGVVAVADIVTMAGEFVGTETVTIAVGSTAVSDDVDIGEDVQAATKTTTG